MRSLAWHREQHLFQRQTLFAVRQLAAGQPGQVCLAPGGFAGIRVTKTQQQRGSLLAFGAQLAHRRTARAAEVAHRLMLRVRHPNRGQIAGTQLSRQRQRITAIVLHPIARPLRDQRRCRHQAIVPKLGDLPIQSVAGRTRFISKSQQRVLLCQLANQPGGCRRGVVDLTEIADLAVSAGFGDRHRVAQFRGIHTDVSNAMLLHGSPSLLEALPGSFRVNPRSASRVSRLCSKGDLAVTAGTILRSHTSRRNS